MVQLHGFTGFFLFHNFSLCYDGCQEDDPKILVLFSPIKEKLGASVGSCIKWQVHEKEFLLKDLTTEGLLGEDRRLGEVCSKRVYRILMAQSGSVRTDDVEDGADFFRRQSS